MTAPDLDLLRQFTRDHSQDAFTALVNRHVNLVFSAALRQVRSHQLAEEVAQSVFTDLSRDAAKLKPDTVLTAWLYQVTRRTAIDVVRREARRQIREQIATGMNAMNASTADWTAIEPLLDEAMQSLDETDRTAVLLRYFENKSLREVGEAIGTGDDAAQKRVSRAVDRLREFFTRRGVTIGASGLVVLISANAVQAAPTGLALAITTTAIAGTAATSAAIAATKTIAMTTFQKVLVTTVLAAAIGTTIYQTNQAAQLRSQLQALQPPASAAQSATAPSSDLTSRLVALQAENDRLKSDSNQTELLKLRGEVGQLRRQLSDLPTARAALLKEKLAAMPDKGIPEIQFLTDKDWADIAWNADLDTDDGIRVALRDLRHKAVDSFFNDRLRPALKKYLAANDDQLPTDLSQLKPYLDPAVTDDMLQHYQLMQTGKVDRSAWVVKKAGYIDPDYDSNQQISLNGGSGGAFNHTQSAIFDAATAYTIANFGQTPTAPSQITPYLKKTIDPAVMQKYFAKAASDIAANPPSPEMAVLAPVLRAYTDANNGQRPQKASDLVPYLTTAEQQAAFQKMQEKYPEPK
jgi:RNA polymerase sigma factor (sigma-70 family)